MIGEDVAAEAETVPVEVEVDVAAEAENVPVEVEEDMAAEAENVTAVAGIAPAAVS